MAEVGSAFVSILPSARGFGSGLQRQVGPDVTSAGRRIGSRFGSVFKSAAKVGILGALALTAGAIKFGADAIGEAREAQKIGAQTEAVIKSTGKAANISEKGVGRLSGQLSKMAGVDDELIQNGANVLLTFTRVRNEAGKGGKIFNRATKSALNMSTALGTDLKGASLQVGKALNDPVKGVTALARAGVQFTTKQKAQIKALVEGGDANAAMALGLITTTTDYNNLLKEQGGDAQKTADVLTRDLSPAQQKLFDMYSEGGHTVEAQKRILEELDTQFAGSAKAQATSSDKLKVAFGNVKESLGEGLLPVVDRFAKFLIREGVPAAERFSDWFNKKGIPGIEDFIEKAKPVYNRVLPKIKDAFEDIKDFGTDAAGAAETMLDSFNGMPSWVKKILAGAAVGGAVIKFSGLGKVAETAGALRGATPLTPMFVKVVGGGGGGPAGGPLGGPKGLALTAAKVTIVGTAAIVFTYATVKAADNTFKGVQSDGSIIKSGVRPGMGADDKWNVNDSTRAYLGLNNAIDLSDSKLRVLRDSQIKYNSTVDKTPREVTTLFKSDGHAQVMADIAELNAALASVGAGGIANTPGETTPRGFGSDAPVFGPGTTVNFRVNDIEDTKRTQRELQRKRARAGH